MADIYTGKLDPITDLEKIDRLVTQLQTKAQKKTILKGKKLTPRFFKFRGIFRNTLILGG